MLHSGALAVKKCPINGFSTYFNRHTRRWAWKEREPSAHPDHVTRREGYATVAHAVAGIRAELARRGELEAARAPIDPPKSRFQ